MVEHGKSKKCPATEYTLVFTQGLEWKLPRSTRAHRTCSAAGAGQDAPHHGAANSGREEGVLAAARL